MMVTNDTFFDLQVNNRIKFFTLYLEVDLTNTFADTIGTSFTLISDMFTVLGRDLLLHSFANSKHILTLSHEKSFQLNNFLLSWPLLLKSLTRAKKLTESDLFLR